MKRSQFCWQFDVCIIFAIQYSNKTLEVVNAKELGRRLNLAVYDPQEGRIIEDAW
jgi:hypothetical protein